MKIAVMQPYFFPYLGYFQLLKAVDLFVFFDCVQFPRRGWVHRNMFTMKNGEVDWLTLPLVKGNRDSTKIMDLKFKNGSREIIQSQFQKTRIGLRLQQETDLNDLICSAEDDVTDYLCSNLEHMSHELGIEVPFMRSSLLKIPSNIKGQNRILLILRELGGSTYVNLSGGANLYFQSDFESRGVNLEILKPYQGQRISILERYLQEEKSSLIQELKTS